MRLLPKITVEHYAHEPWNWGIWHAVGGTGRWYIDLGPISIILLWR